MLRANNTHLLAFVHFLTPAENDYHVHYLHTQFHFQHSSVLSLLGILPDKPTRLHACMLILCYVSNFKQWYSQTTWESSKPFLGTRDGIIHWIIIGLKPRVGQTQRNRNDQRSKKIWIQILLFYFPTGWYDLGCELVCESFILRLWFSLWELHFPLCKYRSACI